MLPRSRRCAPVFAASMTGRPRVGGIDQQGRPGDDRCLDKVSTDGEHGEGGETNEDRQEKAARPRRMSSREASTSTIHNKVSTDGEQRRDKAERTGAEVGRPRGRENPRVNENEGRPAARLPQSQSGDREDGELLVLGKTADHRRPANLPEPATHPQLDTSTPTWSRRSPSLL